MRIIGRIKRVNGPVIEGMGIKGAMMFELVKVGEDHLVGEVIKLEGENAIIQVYEDTTGIAPFDQIYGEGIPLSVELGPGLIGTIYDGIQRPLEAIRNISGTYIERGIEIYPLDRKKKWKFYPALDSKKEITGGMVLGTVRETERIEHRVLIPPDIEGVLESIVPEGEYTVEEPVAIVSTERGQKEIFMKHSWPIRKQRPVNRRLALNIPLVTGQRVIDTLFPVAKGGTVAIPGGFGTGKTMTQQALAKWCDADIIIYIGCGERGNEMTDVLTEFRDQGYHVAIMADSTSRWAEALRELSGRMEEMPAEEGFPAYLPTRIAEFYERAGYMETLSGRQGSVTIIGAVSPPGGDFSEPVTQHTKRFVRCFWALDRNLANARHYPAISWLESYSEYLTEIKSWWEEKMEGDWDKDRTEIMGLLHREVRLQQVVKLVGPDALPDTQRFILEVCSLFKNAFLQQNAFDKIDMFSTLPKQARMLNIILTYWRRGYEAIKRGITLVKLRKMKVYGEIIKMKYTIPNEDLSGLDKIEARLERSFDQLESIYA